MEQDHEPQYLPPSQRRRRENVVIERNDMNLIPKNEELISKHVIQQCTIHVTLQQLCDEDEKVKCVRTDNRYLDLQLLRIIVQDQDKQKVFMYNKTGRPNMNNRNKTEMKYTQDCFCVGYIIKMMKTLVWRWCM